jgi:hypothetical protein
LTVSGAGALRGDSAVAARARWLLPGAGELALFSESASSVRATLAPPDEASGRSVSGGSGGRVDGGGLDTPAWRGDTGGDRCGGREVTGGRERGKRKREREREKKKTRSKIDRVEWLSCVAMCCVSVSVM